MYDHRQSIKNQKGCIKNMTKDNNTSKPSKNVWVEDCEGCDKVGVTRSDIKQQALQQETASYINREAEILRGTSVYTTIFNFIEYYGILYVLRVFSQIVADRFKEIPIYNDLVGGICSLYTTYSTIAIHGDNPKDR